MTEPNVPDETDPVAVAEALTEQFRLWGDRFAGLQRSRTKDRKIVIGLFISIILVVLVAGGLVYELYQNHANQIAACQQANQNRKEDIAIYNRFLRLPPHATAAQKKEVADLKRLVRIKDTPRNCGQLYSSHLANPIIIGK